LSTGYFAHPIDPIADTFFKFPSFIGVKARLKMLLWLAGPIKLGNGLTFVACRPEIFLKNLFLLWLAGPIKLGNCRNYGLKPSSLLNPLNELFGLCLLGLFQ
jgi:hypothetical protein